MSTLRRAVTSIVRNQGPAKNVARAIVTKEVAPHRELVFREDELKTPAHLARALHLVQREAADATQGARSLPVCGGTYWPKVAFSTDTAQQFAHGCQGEVSWLVASVKPGASQSPHVTLGRVVEVSQNTSAGTIVLSSSENVVCDVWFYPKPDALVQQGVAAFAASPGSNSNTLGAPFLWGSVRAYDAVAAGATFTAYCDHEYRITANGAAVTANLDPAPTDGHRLGLKLVGAWPYANALTINATNGWTVELMGTSPGTFGNTTTYQVPGGTLYLKADAGSKTWNECL